MDVVECDCTDWRENIGLVNGPIQLQFIRTGAEYRGKKFTHCPWCGKQLRQKKLPNDGGCEP